MKIEGQLEIEDHVKARRIHQRMGLVGAFFSCVLPILGILNSVWIMARGDGMEKNKLMFILCLMVLVIYPFHWRIESRFFRRKLQKRKQQDGPQQIEISEDGITRETPEGKKPSSWLRVVKYKIGADMLLLYRSSTEYEIFPFRWFTPEAREEFEGYLRKEIGEPVR